MINIELEFMNKSLNKLSINKYEEWLLHIDFDRVFSLI
jgi:hypothetical protein